MTTVNTFLLVLIFSMNLNAENSCQGIFSDPWELQTTEKIKDPFSLEQSLKMDITGNASHQEVLLKLKNLKIIFEETRKNSHTQIKKLNNWIQSEAQALYVYDELYRRSLVDYQITYQWLLKNNYYFKNTYSLPNDTKSLITFGFEKEGSGPEASLLYRDPNISDKDWLNLSDSQRMKILSMLVKEKKYFHTSKEIQATELKPDYLGGYSEEYTGGIRKGFSWELKHKSYELSLNRFLTQIKNLSDLFKNSHSFHFHLVFELSKTYTHFDRFTLWVKWVNDFLTLKGMEEGLHGNQLTNSAEHPRQLSLWNKFKENLGFSLDNNNPIGVVLPKNLSEIDKYSFKFFSMSLRRHLYGDASSSENIKIGLELRDVTRDIGILENLLNQLSRTISNYSWEKFDGKNYFNQSFSRSLSLFENKIHSDFLEQFDSKSMHYFTNLVPTLKFVFIPFESGMYLNYESGKLFKPSSEQVTRIIEARKFFIKELKNIQRNIENLNKTQESFEPEDVEMAVKMSLTEWAKLARVSELFERF